MTEHPPVHPRGLDSEQTQQMGVFLRVVSSGSQSVQFKWLSPEHITDGGTVAETNTGGWQFVM